MARPTPKRPDRRRTIPIPDRVPLGQRGFVRMGLRMRENIAAADPTQRRNHNNTIRHTRAELSKLDIDLENPRELLAVMTGAAMTTGLLARREGQTVDVWTVYQYAPALAATIVTALAEVYVPEEAGDG